MDVDGATLIYNKNEYTIPTIYTTISKYNNAYIERNYGSTTTTTSGNMYCLTSKSLRMASSGVDVSFTGRYEGYNMRRRVRTCHFRTPDDEQAR